MLSNKKQKESGKQVDTEGKEDEERNKQDDNDISEVKAQLKKELKTYPNTPTFEEDD